MGCRQHIKEIKVVASLEGVVVENALTFGSNRLTFGGPLVEETTVSGPHPLTFGTSSSRLTQFNARVNGLMFFEWNNGAVLSSILFDGQGITISNTTALAKGIKGSQDYSDNVDNLSFVQKVYADKKIAGKNISGVLATPGPIQHSYAIVWDDTNQVFTLSPSAGGTAGSNTQVIYNSSGVLTGNPLFTFSGTVLTVPEIKLGSTTALPGPNRIIEVIAAGTDQGLEIRPKGDGDVLLSLLQGSLILGEPSSTNTLRIITANGINSQIDLALEPKGTDGVVYIGNEAEAGGYRYLHARGAATNINLQVKGKGTGSVILDSVLNNAVYVGNPLNSVSYRSIKSGSTGTSDFSIGGNGDNSVVFIGDRVGSAVVRTLQADSFAPDVHLNILGKGAGLVAINGVVNYKKIPIGDWDMNANISATIVHGLPDFRKIINIRVVIRDDSDNTYSPLDCTAVGGSGELEGGITSWNSTAVFLARRSGGFYDLPTHGSTGYNRGWVYINYAL